jgi:hypothetical protein
MLISDSMTTTDLGHDHRRGKKEKKEKKANIFRRVRKIAQSDY